MENAMPFLFIVPQKLFACPDICPNCRVCENIGYSLWFGDHQRSGSVQRFVILEIQKVWLWPKDLYKPLLEDCLIKMTLFNEKDLLNPRTRMWGKWRGRLNERFASSRKYVWKSWDYQTFKDHFWPYLVYSHIAIYPVPTTLVIVYCCRYDKRWSSVE